MASSRQRRRPSSAAVRCAYLLVLLAVAAVVVAIVADTSWALRAGAVAAAVLGIIALVLIHRRLLAERTQHAVAASEADRKHLDHLNAKVREHATDYGSLRRRYEQRLASLMTGSATTVPAASPASGTGWVETPRETTAVTAAPEGATGWPVEPAVARTVEVAPTTPTTPLPVAEAPVVAARSRDTRAA